MQFYYLTDEFFNDYSITTFPEFERKSNRPYKVLITKYNSHNVAIPLRSNVRHDNKIATIGDKGLDFSKAVILLKDTYINLTVIVPVDNSEISILSRHGEHVIQSHFIRYTKKYKNDFTRLNTGKLAYGSVGYRMCYNTVHRSTLQYFHSIIGLTEEYDASQYQAA